MEYSMCVLGGAGSIYLTNILSLPRNILVYVICEMKCLKENCRKDWCTVTLSVSDVYFLFCEIKLSRFVC